MRFKTLLIFSLLLSLTTLLGWIKTPRSSDGAPLLLLPQTRAVQAYQRQALGWTSALAGIDGRLSVLLAGNSKDLMRASREAEGIHHDLVELYQEIDQKGAPDALAGLRGEMLDTTLVYLETSSLALSWISTREEASLARARVSLLEAHTLFQAIAANPWLKQQ